MVKQTKQTKKKPHKQNVDLGHFSFVIIPQKHTRHTQNTSGVFLSDFFFCILEVKSREKKKHNNRKEKNIVRSASNLYSIGLQNFFLSFQLIFHFSD